MFGSLTFASVEFAGIIGVQTVLPPIPPSDNPYCKADTPYSRIDSAYTDATKPYSRFPNVCN